VIEKVQRRATRIISDICVKGEHNLERLRDVDLTTLKTCML